MTEEQLHEFVKELQSNSIELSSFIAENCDENLTEDEIDDLISDFESDYLSLREFVINAMED